MTRACERRQHGARGGRVLGRVTVRRSGAGDIRLARAPFSVDLPIEGISHAVAGAWADPAVHAGSLGSCFIRVGSLTPAFLPADNAFNHVWLLRELQHGAGRVLATAVLLFGVLILLWAWLRLHPRDDGVDVSRATLALWGLPLLLAPPLFSSDAYSYAAQGQIVHQGFDPYAVGPGLLGGHFAEQVDPLWLWTPAPYGPLALQIQHAVVDLMGSNPYASAVGMRLPAIAALVVIATLLPRIATALGRDPRLALWLARRGPQRRHHDRPGRGGPVARDPAAARPGVPGRGTRGGGQAASPGRGRRG